MVFDAYAGTGAFEIGAWSCCSTFSIKMGNHVFGGCISTPKYVFVSYKGLSSGHLVEYSVFYKKPSSRPSTKSLLIFGQIFVVEVS